MQNQKQSFKDTVFLKKFESKRLDIIINILWSIMQKELALIRNQYIKIVIIEIIFIKIVIKRKERKFYRKQINS